MMTKLWRNQSGLSMIEALVAMFILAIISAPILGAFMVARGAQAESTGRAIAQSLARDEIEWVQQIAYANFDDPRVAHNAPAGDSRQSTRYPSYTITRLITDDTPITINGTDVVVMKTVEAVISWQGTQGRQLAHRLGTRLERRK